MHLKYGEALEGYGRNKGGRYLHKIRGGAFVEGQVNAALCWVDVTKPASGDDYRREICGECLRREDPQEERVPMLRRLARGSIESALYSLGEARKQLAGAELSRMVEELLTDAFREMSMAKAEIEKAERGRT